MPQIDVSPIVLRVKNFNIVIASFRAADYQTTLIY